MLQAGRVNDDFESSVDEITRGVTWAATERAEAWISRCRLVFCGSLLIRSLFYDLRYAFHWQSLAVELPTLLVGMLFSLAMLRAARLGRLTQASLRVSVVLDALLCFCSLLQTALWPGGDLAYGGLLTKPDMSAMLIVVYCAGYRLSPPLALTSGVLNGCAFLALVLVERQWRGAALGYGSPAISMFACVLGGVTALSVATAARTRRLVASGAIASLQIERARRELACLVRDQHDARSLLTAAGVHADLVGRALRRSSDAAPALHGLAERLRDDLAAASGCLRALAERAFGQLASLHELETVELDQVLPQVIACARLRYPALAIETRCASLPPVRIAGGRASLERVLFNVLSNAVEGDGGGMGASRLCVEVTRPRREGAAAAGPPRVCITFDDDGPGFPDLLLAGGETKLLTTKPGGSGFGLYGVARIVSGSGGRLRCENHPGGARVRILLPMAAITAHAGDGRAQQAWLL